MITFGISCDIKRIDGKIKYVLSESYIEYIHSIAKLVFDHFQIIVLTPYSDVSTCDILIIPGGGKLHEHIENHPTLEKTNPVRYKYDYDLIHEFVQKNKPIFGICRGMQMINEYFGGTTEYFSEDLKIKHNDATHDIIFQNKNFRVNSFHSKRISILAQNLKILAVSGDGIEAIAHISKNICGVQWHPELFDETHIFKHFLINLNIK